MHMPKIWPFYKKPKPVPEAVHELDLVNADGTPASYPQYWKRNTLVIDLSGVSGTGSVAARLPDETTWPVRVAVRVQPGSVQQIEVQGEERNVLPVAAEGTMPIDLEFAPSVYRRSTAGYLHLLGLHAAVRGSRDRVRARSRIRVADAGARDFSAGGAGRNHAQRQRDHPAGRSRARSGLTATRLLMTLAG